MIPTRPPNRRKAVKILHPHLRLSVLVKRPGGVSRDEAIAEATRQVEVLRVPYMTIIDDLIAQLENAALPQRRAAEDLSILQRLADRLITLGGTFGLMFLVEAAKRFLDVMQAFEVRGITDEEAVAVYVQAIRLLGPLQETLSSGEAENVLSELGKIHEYFRIKGLDDIPSPGLKTISNAIN